MKNTKSVLLVALLLVFATQIFAQREETIFNGRNWGFSGLWGGYNHQYTQYNKTDGYNRGGFFGFEFGKSLTLGWSHADLQDDINLGGNESQRFDYRYNGGKIGYAFMPYKAIHPIVNFEVGRGKFKLAGSGSDNTLVLQPSAGLEINIFRWFRLGLEGGYRYINGNDLAPLTDAQLSGMYGQATLKFGFSWGRYHKRTPAGSTTNKYEG